MSQKFLPARNNLAKPPRVDEAWQYRQKRRGNAWHPSAISARSR
jgi:hypothetical protein